MNVDRCEVSARARLASAMILSAVKIGVFPAIFGTNKQSFENGVIGDLFIYFIKNQCVEAKKMVKSVH